MIFIGTPSGEQQQLEESVVREKYRDGRFPAGTLYWREGMAEWQPLEEFIQQAAEYAAPPASGYRFVKDPGALTITLLVFLFIGLGADVLTLISDNMQLSMLGREFTEQEATLNDLRQGVIALAYIGIYLITVVIFSMWIYRANKNSHGFGARGMQFTPGWSVGFFFIPIVCLWKPYQAMKEMWQVSKDPSNWEVQDARFVGLWWGLWLVTNISGQIVFRTVSDAVTIEDLQRSTQISMASSVVSIALTIAAIMLVRRLIQQQRALVENRT